VIRRIKPDGRLFERPCATRLFDSGLSANKKRAEAARSLLVLLVGGVSDHAACLCIVPLADAVPRIARTERSIAAHSRPISAAARPSA
jgi:hypothetical protein